MSAMAPSSADFAHPDLNKDRVELFLAALESGKYTQCTGRMRERLVPIRTMIMAQRHCALGVATEVALNNGLRQELETEFGTLTQGFMDALFDGGDLSPCVAIWYGFSTEDPILAQHNGNWRSVAGLNDSGWTFWDIAQAGRARWLKDQGDA